MHDREHRSETGIVRRTVSTDPEVAEFELLEIVAELEGTTIENLPSLYHEVDHLVENVFETPPSAESQVQLAFSYAGYRITLDRNGNVELLRVKASLEE